MCFCVHVQHTWVCARLQAVVRRAVSDLRVSVSGKQLTAGEGVSVDVELFTTMKHLLVLNLTLSAEHGSNGTKDHLSNTDGGDFTNEDKNISDHTREMICQKNSNYHECNKSNRGNISYDNLNQNHSNISCHGGTHLYLSSDTHLRTSNHSSCHLHLHLQCRLPTTAGPYHLIASLLSTSDPPSALLSATLPRALVVYERIRALRPSGSWQSVVSTRGQFSQEVVSPASRRGSRVIWTFSLDDVIVLSRTTEEWNVNVSLTIAGCYKVTAKAFNPISWASCCTHILVQEPVGELVLNAPSVITTNQKHSISFSVTAGSNVTVSLLVNATLWYRNSSYTTGDKATVVLLFNHTGAVVVELRAENRVSSQNESARVCVEGNRKPSPQVRVNPTWKPPTRHSPVHSLADNGEEVF